MLNILDLSVSAPSPLSLSLNQTGSASVSFQVTALGTFAQTPVSLSCGNLPVNVSCSFAPSASIVSDNFSPINVVMTVSTNGAATGSYPGMTIVATRSNPSITRSQPLPLSICPCSDLSVSNLSAPGKLAIGHTGHFVFSIKDTGPSDAANVVINLSWTAPLKFSSVTASQGGNCSAPSGNSVACAFSSIANGGSSTVDIGLLALLGVSGNVSANAVSDAADSNPANNTGFVTVKVRPLPLTIR